MTMALNELNDQMDEISKRMIDIENIIIKGESGNKNVHAKIYAVRKLYLRAELTINRRLLSGKLQKNDITQIASY